jgi:predicted signal transduction protein with EAL and GGDEF domain
VTRLGGDEFVVILEDLSGDVQEAAVQTGAVGEKVRAALAKPYSLDGREFHCAASLGVVLFRDDEESVETLLKHADLAMYKAKSAGRNTLRFFDPTMQTALDERSALEADLRLAVDGGQLHLQYQPQVDSERRLIGAEALVRWAHPERGLVPPDDFIPLAEETGLILPIGHWVLATACAQIRAWSANAATGGLRLAVNVSARQFRQPDFVAQVRQVLAQAGADPGRLKIELTESMVLDDIGDTFEKMHALKSLGIGFSLDDFGTGNSSLAYLTRLPLDQLKIDRSFVRNLPGNRNDAIIAQTIITMARSLGLDVIAEGVETEVQRGFLDRHNCTAYQGYLFSRPLPLDEFNRQVRIEGGVAFLDTCLPA